jgi:hypothetical protein
VHFSQKISSIIRIPVRPQDSLKLQTRAKTRRKAKHANGINKTTISSYQWR